jgi:hypothetical protein
MLSRTAAVLIIIDIQANSPIHHNKETLFQNNVRLIRALALSLRSAYEQIPEKLAHHRSAFAGLGMNFPSRKNLQLLVGHGIS